MHKQRGNFILKSIAVYFIVAFVILFIIVNITRKFMSPLEGAAKGFYTAIKDNQYEDAYLLLSTRRQQEINIYDFVTFIKNNSLNEIANTTWHSPTYNKSETVGKILGSVQLKSGRNFPIEMSFVLEPDDGRIIFKDIKELDNVPYLEKLKIWKVDQINLHPKMEKLKRRP